ncbi:DUF512 domain-containing protein [Candidatus Desantisbacteria bacterium]|nr:DUF512 domain-containing protein [Candidatus Desantisbacteria bacterium]
MVNCEISEIVKDSIAEELGIDAGHFLISIDGKQIHDIIEYDHEISKEFLTLEILKPVENEVWEFKIEKDEFEDIGIKFTQNIFDNVKTCKNNCIFCFVNQMPRGMRKSVYIKDEDYRTSFLYGSYMTLSGIKDKEIDYIIRMKLSPLYISVHATDPSVRIKLLKNPDAGNILKNIQKLTGGGIQLHTQAVLVPGVNDGKILEKTVEDLADMFPYVQSLSIVPVGITKYNKTGLKPYNKDESIKICDYVLNKGKEFKKKSENTFVFIADEFLVKAGYDIPKTSYYENFEASENGVGLVRMLLDEANELKGCKLKYNGNATLACGESIYPYLKKILKRFTSIKVFPIKNYFFGDTVTVTGLITGSDLIKNLKGKDMGDEIIINSIMLNDNKKFLDDYSIPEVSKVIGVKIRCIDNIKEIFIF